MILICSTTALGSREKFSSFLGSVEAAAAASFFLLPRGLTTLGALASATGAAGASATGATSATGVAGATASGVGSAGGVDSDSDIKN